MAQDYAQTNDNGSPGGAANSNGPTNGSLVGVESLGPRPTERLISDVILLAHALIVRPHLFVREYPGKPKEISVYLTCHTCDGGCESLVTISLRAFVVLNCCTGL